jgi:5-methylcytosine-specific restriction endonuclease McrA
MMKGTYPALFHFYGFMQLSEREKLEDLRKYSKVKVKYYVSRQSRMYRTMAERRRQFDVVKGKYYKMWPVCVVCETRRTRHIHHLITLANNGANGEKNLVGLCIQCHQKVHPWLRR